jgi:hypothetical protein
VAAGSHDPIAGNSHNHRCRNRASLSSSPDHEKRPRSSTLYPRNSATTDHTATGRTPAGEEAQKLENERQATIVGAVVVRHARTNMDFRRQLAAILRAEVKAKADLAAIAGPLIDPPVAK